MSGVTTGLSATDLAVDRELADLAESFRFLLDVTPVNATEAKAEFLTDHCEPAFVYRPLDDRPDILRARLSSIDVQSVDDPVVAHLLRAKHREIELRIEMLDARGTDDFLHLSLELFGGVLPPLLDEAAALLDSSPPPPSGAPEPPLDARTFARLVEEELDSYRAVDPDIRAHVEVRDDTSGVMVLNGDVLIGASLTIAPSRVGALLQHEVGTHVVTHVNGSRQPLRVLASGLAGYEETQEGLAVLAEYLGGGLTAARLRELAARVVAVHRMIGGEPFVAVHRALTAVGLTDAGAFTTTMRVFRSGGFTKDAIYLRGLREVTAHLGAGGRLDVLLLGKLPLVEAPLVEDLLARGLLAEPLLRPSYLADPAVADRLTHLEHVTCLADLLRS